MKAVALACNKRLGERLHQPRRCLSADKAPGKLENNDLIIHYFGMFPLILTVLNRDYSTALL